MSYLLDKKAKRKKISEIALGAVLLITLFYFRISIWNILSRASEVIFHPVLVLGNNFAGEFKNLNSYFISKNSLYAQNQILQSRLNEDEMRVANYDSVVRDNASIKEILNRKDPKMPMILSAILAKPNQNAYDTLVIDGGAKVGMKEGDTVFALGDLPIGKVAMTYDNSAKVILFSNAGESTEGVISGKGVFVELVGRGGGNFEMDLPKDLVLQKGDQIVMPGMNPYLLAVVEKIISDPRDPLTKVLLSSPVNVEEIKFVEVETSP